MIKRFIAYGFISLFAALYIAAILGLLYSSFAYFLSVPPETLLSGLAISAALFAIILVLYLGALWGSETLKK